MSLIHKIADWLDPSRKVLAESQSNFDAAVIREMRAIIDTGRKGTDALVERMSDAATQIMKLRDHRSSLRSALITARNHVMAVYDEELAKFEGLGKKSPQRVPQQLAVEAVKVDLKTISDALAATGDVQPPVQS